MSILKEVILAFTVQDRKSTTASAILSATLATIICALALFVPSEDGRLVVLRISLVVVALGEFLAAMGQGLLTRSLFARQGRPEHPLHIHTAQDFSIYNFAMSLGLLLAAVDPIRNSVVIDVYIVLALLHAGSHALRYLHPARFERGSQVRQGLPLVIVALTMLLFHP